MSSENDAENVQEPLLSSSKQLPKYTVQVNVSDEQEEGDTDGSSPRRRNQHNIHPVTNFRVWILSLACIICFVVVRVVLPIYSASMNKAGGDVFTVLLYICMWFPFVLAAFTILYKALWDRTTTLLPAVSWRVLWLMGALSLGNGFCSTFASPPNRTPPYLQGLLVTMRIPFTVLIRFAVLRKGLSLRRVGCTVAVLIGIFITVEPQIWSLPGSAGSAIAGGSSTARIIWPLIFTVGFLPAAANTVLCERELKHGQVQSLSFITWTQFFQMVTIIPLFWVDFIPFFGMATSFEQFVHRLRTGFACNLSSAEDCYGLALKGWIFILGFCLGNLFQFLLIQRAEGAVFAVVVQSIVTPLATLFWTVFRFDAERDLLYWHPVFTETTGFTVGGLLIIVPAVVLYNVFSRWDAKEAEAVIMRKESE